MKTRKAPFVLAIAVVLMAQTAGALDLDVPVGGDIQKAIDEVSSAGGGSVSLAAGVHLIDAAIRMRSNVELRGKGSSATTIKTSNVIKSIVQASEGLRNVTIQDLGITGVAVHGSHAIHLVSYKKDHRNIKLSGVHASQTGWGVHIKGADGVVITNCAFTGNGAKGKEGYAHNLYLRRCKNALVSNTKLNGSTSGNGCNISYSENVTIDRCEVLDNYFRGIRAADSDGYTVKNSIIGRNGEVGLLANREKVATKNIEFVNNVVFGNGEGGIQASNGVTGGVTRCTSFNNKRFDFDLNDDIRRNDNSTAAVDIESGKALKGWGRRPPRMLTPPQVWNTYDPNAGDYNEEVLKRWTSQDARYKEVRFSAYIGGQTVRVYGIYAAPSGADKDGARMAAVMHLHGGGQTVNRRWLEAWTVRGYAALTCNYHGQWPGREKVTAYPDALKQGNHRLAGEMRMATVPDVRASSWYIWAAVARRALSYLRQQPEVDRERIGAFGVSMGGTTIWPLAMDRRLKAACAIYGCGWNRYWRHVSRFAPPGERAAMTHDDRVWLAGMAPEACAPHIRCPVLFLSATNDNHGNMDRAYQTLERLPAGIERRQAFTPRFSHHVGADFGQDLFLWMDRWLRGGAAWPAGLAAKVSLGPDGVPVVTVTPDRPADVESVAVYYALANPRPVSRNWRNAAATRVDNVWRAAAPVMDTKAWLFVFANVRYKSGVHLSSSEAAVIPSSLGNARATDVPSAVLYDGSDGTGMWTTGSPCTDPVPPERIPVPIRAARGPDGKAGFTVSSRASPRTFQPGDPKWRAPQGAALRFSVATATGERFKAVFHENYFWPGQKRYEANVSLEARPGWQSVTLTPADFHEVTRDGAAGSASVGFSRCEVLELAGPWKDKNIVFADFRWVTARGRAAGC